MCVFNAAESIMAVSTIASVVFVNVLTVNAAPGGERAGATLQPR